MDWVASNQSCSIETSSFDSVAAYLASRPAKTGKMVLGAVSRTITDGNANGVQVANC